MEDIIFYEPIKLQRKVSTYVRRHEPAYASMSLCTQVGFQKPMKGKFSALKIEVWNESHIF